MFILKIFHDVTHQTNFQNYVLSMTKPFVMSTYHSSGLYSKLGKNTIKILNVENNPSLRGENFNILFYGLLIPWFSKKLLLGWIGPSLIYTIFTLLVVLLPFEYIEFRIIAFAVWIIVYLGNRKKITHLKHLILEAFVN